MRNLYIIPTLIIICVCVSIVIGTVDDATEYHSIDSDGFPTDTLIDDSGNGLPADNQGGTQDSSGYSSNAINLDGDSKHIETNRTDCPTAMTLIWRNKMDIGSLASSSANIMNKGDGPSGLNLAYIKESSSPKGLRFYNDGSGYQGNIDNTTFRDGNWHHFAFIKNGTSVKLRVDDNQEMTGTITITCSTNGWSLGKSTVAQGLWNSPTDLSVDEVAIYDRAFTAAEITESFELTQSPYISATLEITNSTFNMTSDGGCDNWTTTPRTKCDTTDGTPTLTFDTVGIGNCSLTDTDTVYNQDYICSTTGSTTHVCTLSSDYKLDFGLSNLYVSCITATGSSQVNSSALPINMTAGGGGGSGLISCISTLGSGCGVSIADNCAAIIQS